MTTLLWRTTRRARKVVTTSLTLALALTLAWAFTAQAQTRTGILYGMDFEKGTYSPLWPDGNSRISIVNSPVRAGSRSALFELSRSDKVSYRTELTFQGVHTFRIGQVYWLGMSVRLSNNWVKDYSKEIIAQIHSWPDKDLGEVWRNPPIALMVDGDQWLVRIRADSKPLTKMGQYELDKTYGNLGAIKRGQWTDWVFRINYRYDSQGSLEAWMDGKKVINHKGPVTQNDKGGGFLKVGVYKWDWQGGSTATSSRALHIDEVRIGGSNSNYASVAPSGTDPGGGTPAPNPTPDPDPDPDPKPSASLAPSNSLLLITRPFSLEGLFEELGEELAPNQGEPYEESPTREYSFAEMEAPVLASPSGDSPRAAPELTWREVEGATGYLYSIQGPNGLVFDQEYIPAAGNCSNGQCRLSLPFDLDDGAYTWWVASSGDHGTSRPSRALAFSVNRSAPPAKPVCIAPEGVLGASGPELVWSATQGAEEYELRVSNVDGVVYETRLSAEAAGGQCSTQGLELAAGSYTWTVRAMGATGNSGWSEPMGFSVNPGAASPQPLGSSRVAHEANPVLIWTHLPETSMYEVEVRDDSGVIFLRALRAGDVAQGGTCSVEGPRLEAGKQYLWRVRDQHDGAWSDMARLRLGEPAEL